MSGVQQGENLDVALGTAMAVLPGVGLLSLVGLYALVALIVLALRVRGLGKGRGLQGVLNPRGGNE